ncbi:methyl-accepting chemotaxis protein [Actinoplanes sp. L3-i22]|uniref:methyl-accepting chemotaxis protein n=1 Tax=Actinoplanes sp. L3-i22 TaxID=2836373 RepID=UPI001C78393B|nr:methyl-accepting chemotaxis protein [Actinoplanes sp. L3-i22]BCY11530.1 hypothetical protein L3i22_066180 [Actinoplanes sp. L3-i22]
MNVVTAWLADRSMRTKVLAPVLIAALGLGAVAWYATTALSTAGQRTRAMYANTARPLADLAALRDAQGDLRVGVRNAILFDPGPAQEEAIAGFQDTDTALDAALAAFVTDSGSLDAQRADLVTQARAGIASWRGARDDQLVPLVRAGKAATAEALLTDAGALGKANATFGGALDTLLTAETDAAARVASAADAAQRRAGVILVVVALICVLLAIVIGVLVARMVVLPLRRVHHVLDQLASGDLTGDPQVSSRDEVGRMASALLAAGASLRRTVGTVIDSARTLDDAADRLQDSSTQITRRVADSADRAAQVADAAGTASNSINTVTAGATEMTSAIAEIAERAARAAAVASGAVQVVTSTTATVSDLGRTSADIEQVLKVITTIAEQTNLLALNATIEAARAGETGKGFAVVAGEVKELAQQTAAATEDIARRITAIQATSREAIGAIAQIGEVIAEINDHQGAIAAAVEEQTATTGEMRRNVTDAAAASTQIASTVTEVARAARAAEAEAEQSQQVIATVATMARDLRRTIDHFQH